jgi:C4-dicarboxylate transporter, DctM subunit
MVEAIIASLLLLALIVAGVNIYAALGLSGALGLLLTRGVNALALVPTSFFGQLNSFEMIALPLFIPIGFGIMFLQYLLAVFMCQNKTEASARLSEV